MRVIHNSKVGAWQRQFLRELLRTLFAARSGELSQLGPPRPHGRLSTRCAIRRKYVYPSPNARTELLCRPKLDLGPIRLDGGASAATRRRSRSDPFTLASVPKLRIHRASPSRWVVAPVRSYVPSARSITVGRSVQRGCPSPQGVGSCRRRRRPCEDAKRTCTDMRCASDSGCAAASEAGMTTGACWATSTTRISQTYDSRSGIRTGGVRGRVVVRGGVVAGRYPAGLRRHLLGKRRGIEHGHAQAPRPHPRRRCSMERPASCN